MTAPIIAVQLSMFNLALLQSLFATEGPEAEGWQNLNIFDISPKPVILVLDRGVRMMLTMKDEFNARFDCPDLTTTKFTPAIER